MYIDGSFHLDGKSREWQWTECVYSASSSPLTLTWCQTLALCVSNEGNSVKRSHGFTSLKAVLVSIHVIIRILVHSFPSASDKALRRHLNCFVVFSLLVGSVSFAGRLLIRNRLVPHLQYLPLSSQSGKQFLWLSLYLPQFSNKKKQTSDLSLDKAFVGKLSRKASVRLKGACLL